MTRILIHGALGSASQMQPLADALGGGPHIVELEGHGSTPMSANRYEMSRFVQNVRDSMRDAGIERADIFGYSMGGYVALMLAAESPELVTSVTTLGTKLAWSPDAAAKETSRLDPATIRAKVPKFSAALEARHGAGNWEAVLRRTAALMTELGANPVVQPEMLSRISQPVRLMVGDRDAIVTLEETAAAARSLPAGELAVLPNTAHPFEQVHLPLLAALLL
jgi:pimeloyl-ACP methyl ester carboxylesterase